MPVLLIMAAGMGSRYGGLKQMDPVGSGGELLLDFALYDAWMAGFKKVIFIISKEMEESFRARVDQRAGKFLETAYAVQSLSDLPPNVSVPADRKKPWGTCHAVLACRHLVDGPFAVINADDYYGPDAFQKVMDFLLAAEDARPARCCMVGYKLENTLTEHGTVARGVCEVSGDGFLTGIVERTKIAKKNGKALFTEDDGGTWEALPDGALVSMNFWGFSKSVMAALEDAFPAVLDRVLKENPLSGEFLLPFFVDQLLREGKAAFEVLLSGDRWYGVTYKEDKALVSDAIQSMKDKGLYPETLWK